MRNLYHIGGLIEYPQLKKEDLANLKIPPALKTSEVVLFLHYFVHALVAFNRRNLPAVERP